MKIVRFLGGLGNQMFQYAFYASLQKKYSKVQADLSKFNTYKLHNGFELEQIFEIKLNRASKFSISLYDPECKEHLIRNMRKIFKIENFYCFQKDPFYYDKEIYNHNTSKLYWGYWQNVNYLTEITSQLKLDFKFKNRIENADLLSRINDSNSVSIHVRRGDYVNDPLLKGICDLNYFKRSIDLFNQNINSPRYFVFSDDLIWCKANLNIPNATYVADNSGINSYKDMQLMALCKHNIISNSTFSWWGGWLNSNPDKIVIAPNKWYNISDVDTSGLLPKEWIKH